MFNQTNQGRGCDEFRPGSMLHYRSTVHEIHTFKPQGPQKQIQKIKRQFVNAFIGNVYNIFVKL